MLRVLAGAGLLLVLAAPASRAAESWGYELAHELLSPFCPGRTLASCPSDKADELRIWILMQEAAGASREEVEDELVVRYGESILPAPPPRDVTALAGYAVPILALVAGAPLVLWLLRRLRASPPAALQPAVSGPAGQSDDDLAAEVDRELRERSA